MKLDLKNIKRKRDFWPSIEQNITYQTQLPFNPHLHSICLFQKLCHRDFFGLHRKTHKKWSTMYKITKRMCSTQTLHLGVFIELLWSILIWIHLRKTPVCSMSNSWVLSLALPSDLFLGVLPDLYLGDQKVTWKKPKGVEMCGPAERPHNRKTETMRNCNTSAQQDIAIWNYLMTKWCNLNMFAWQECPANSFS